jgi:hypothetical protein
MSAAAWPVVVGGTVVVVVGRKVVVLRGTAMDDVVDARKVEVLELDEPLVHAASAEPAKRPAIAIVAVSALIRTVLLIQIPQLLHSATEQAEVRRQIGQRHAAMPL